MSHEPGDQVSELVEGWRTLSRWEQQGHPGVRQWNRLVDQLNRLAEAAVHDPDQVRALQRVAEQDQDPSVRLRARQVARPFVPRPDSAADLERWLNNPLVGLGGLELNPQPGLAVVPDPDVEDLTWFCGEPVAGLTEWPRRADGIPLVHLLQVRLDDHGPLSRRHPAMRTEGVLQFFHDLEAIGDEPVDGESGGWLVHHTLHPDAVPLLLGHSAEERHIADQRLAGVLPLTGRDDYVLLADLPGVGPLDGWVGDMGHIEFWIRDSDLAKQDFARAWALLR